MEPSVYQIVLYYLQPGRIDELSYGQIKDLISILETELREGFVEDQTVIENEKA
jgi:hypothetical protein